MHSGFDRILYEEKSEEGWTLSSGTDMVEVWTKSEPDTPVHLIKVTSYIKSCSCHAYGKVWGQSPEEAFVNWVL